MYGAALSANHGSESAISAALLKARGLHSFGNGCTFSAKVSILTNIQQSNLSMRRGLNQILHQGEAPLKQQSNLGSPPIILLLTSHGPACSRGLDKLDKSL